MGAVCTKSLKQIKLENTPVITTRLVFVCFKKSSIIILISQLKRFSRDVNLLLRSLMNVLWVIYLLQGVR